MPKSLTLPLRRWPCCPGPYSRRLTGLLGRPKTFSPIRRSSLYLALERFDICHSNSRSIGPSVFRRYGEGPVFPGPAPSGHELNAAAASPGVRSQLRRGAPNERRRERQGKRLFGGGTRAPCRFDTLLRLLILGL